MVARDGIEPPTPRFSIAPVSTESRTIQELAADSVVILWRLNPLFASLFTPDGAYESPVGAGGVTGRAAISAECDKFNLFVGVDGAGYYPGPFFSSNNRSAFTLQIRTVSTGGCKVDLNGIVSVHYDEATDKLSSWQHHYDAVWDAVTLTGRCPSA